MRPIEGFLAASVDLPQRQPLPLLRQVEGGRDTAPLARSARPGVQAQPGYSQSFIGTEASTVISLRAGALEES